MRHHLLGVLATLITSGVLCASCLGGGVAQTTSTTVRADSGGRRVHNERVVLVPIPALTGDWRRDPPPPIASAPVRLLPAPMVVTRLCQAAQAKTSLPVLCPTLLPRPILPGAPGTALSTAWDTLLHSGGLELAYGAPWEAGSGAGWRSHLWRNRPCCFFHFTLDWYTGREPADGYFAYGGGIPSKPAVVGGYRGTLYLETIADHVVFLFTRNGVHYDVSEHSFGPGTLRVLSAIVEQLRPIG